jgi:hypothetical protein
MSSTLASKTLRLLGFAVVVAASYLGLLVGAARVSYRERPLLAYLSSHLVEPGGAYQSLRRFRELERRDRLDLAFFGSSHAYRGFDPEIFETQGLRTFNLGSTNQTPLNSLYLAKRYLPTRAPKLVVFEVYYATLAGDGFESTRDLSINTPWSPDILKMALSTRHLGATSFSLAKGLGLIGDSSAVEQGPVEGETYAGAGYVSSEVSRGPIRRREPFRVDVLDRQLDYLRDASRYAQSLGAKVAWTTHPLPRDHRAAVLNFDELHATIADSAKAFGLRYYRYDDDLGLDDRRHFADFHHLNAAGVERFNRALLADLKRDGYLD